MAFETLVFNALHHYTRLGDAANHLDRVAGKLKEHLGFEIIR